MEITCNRCKTEYEFDDALVSERGTTVRCTNCGEQFKVYRTERSALPERWVVGRRDGRELVFTNLRDLQRAITNMQVGRHDTLTRGSAPPRPLASIAELEPFFLGRLGVTAASPGATGPGTDPGLAPHEQVSGRAGNTGRSPLDGHAAPVPPPMGSPPIRPLSNVMHGEADNNSIGRTVIDPSTEPTPAGGYGYTDALIARTHASTRIGPSYDPPPSDSYRPEANPYRPDAGGYPTEANAYRPEADIYRPESYSPEQDWFDEPRFSTIPPQRSRALRWLVVLVLLGMLGVAGATVGRKYVAMVVRPTPAPAATEGRVESLLEEGDRALSDGDLETAKESFDKASALAEHDPRVLIDLARLDAARADADWLRVRLLPASQPDVVGAEKRQSQQSSQRALRLANQAAEAAPDDPKMARTKIDALRIAGDLAGARMLVARVGAIAAQPETAYVLAALDLAEESPNWPAVLDRLRTAAAAESNPGRARGALVYALGRSGDLHLAKVELEKIAAAARPYPLIAPLKAFVARMSGVTPEPDPGKRETAGAGAESDAVGGGNYKGLLQQASQAAASGNYDRAEKLYRAALAKNPGDTEALGGLGDVARARGNPSVARGYYERVLANNPHYLPALAALADIKWDARDRAGAAKLYREVADATPDQALAQRAKDRIAHAEEAPAPRAPRPSVGRPPLPPVSPPPSDEPPEIDTSDLPGFKR